MELTDIFANHLQFIGRKVSEKNAFFPLPIWVNPIEIYLFVSYQPVDKVIVTEYIDERGFCIILILFIVSIKHS